MTYAFLFAAILWLAYANGANDNFKGVATLYGSGVASFRVALAWATLTTLLGSLLSLVLAAGLVKVFSGSGLLPEELLGEDTVLLSAGTAAAATIMLATVLGMPTSTTHALAGALLGVAWTTTSLSGLAVPFLTLFAAPLLISPFLAISLAAVIHPTLHRIRIFLGISRESCVCLEPSASPRIQISEGPETDAAPVAPSVHVGTVEQCRERYAGKMVGLDAHTVATAAHYLSGGAVCFSRAVNDTPKIAAILLGLNGLGTYTSVSCVTVAMVVGGLLQSRRVAETMSRRITEINPGQGLCANLVTAALVLFASRLGVPVSTTHVSCGAILGVGLTEGKAHWKTVGAVIATWVTTFPLAALLSACIYLFSKTTAG